jgi:hypothetical protein
MSIPIAIGRKFAKSTGERIILLFFAGFASDDYQDCDII